MPKRIAKSESPVAAGMPRTKRASATHSKKPSAQASSETMETSMETAAAPFATPEQEVVARLAYSYWEERGYAGGSPDDDWFRAEQELLRQQ